MIVIDTSVLVDCLFEKDPNRNKIAKKTIKILKDLKVFVPRIFSYRVYLSRKKIGNENN